MIAVSRFNSRSACTRALTVLVTSLGISACASLGSHSGQSQTNASAAQTSARQSLNTLEQANLPDEFSAQQLLNANPTVLSEADQNTQWWEGFKSPLINQLVLESLQTSPLVRQAQARLEEAQARLRSIRGAAALEVNANTSLNLRSVDRSGNQAEASSSTGNADGTSSNSGTSNSGTSTGSNNRDSDTRSILLGLQLSLPLDINGKLSAEVESAMAAERVALAGLRQSLLAVSTDTVIEYLRYRGGQKQLQLLKESVQLQENTLRIVRVRFETGLSPELDLQRAQTSVQNLKATLPDLQQTLSASLNRLANLSGLERTLLQQQLETQDNLPNYLQPLPEFLPLQAARSRPEVQSAEWRVLQAMADAGVARADLYPSLSLNAQLQIGREGLTGLDPVSIVIASLNALLQQNLIDGGQRRATLQAAEARSKAALAAYEIELRNTVEVVENQLSALTQSRLRLNALKAANESSQRSFDQANALYQLGLASFLDVIDAQRLLANAQQNLSSEQTRQAVLTAALFRALGLGPTPDSQLSDQTRPD